MRIDEQIRAAKPGRSVLLSASAGSGKTHVLVRRVIHLLAAGAGPDEIAAITFTEKAAAQMKARLFRELAGAAWDGKSTFELLGLEPSDPPFPLSLSPEEIFSELTARPDALGISTIHAFCLGLLKRFPLEAGVPPEFRILDDSEIPVRRIAAVDECVEKAEEVGLASDFMTLSDTGLTIGKIKGLLLSALDKRGHIARMESELGGFDRLLSGIEGAYKKNEDKAAELLSGNIADEASVILGLLNAYPGLSFTGMAAVVTGLERLQSIRKVDELSAAFEYLSEYFYTAKLEYRAKSPFTKTAANEALKGNYKGTQLKEKVAALVAEHDVFYGKLRENVNELAQAYDGMAAAKALASFLRLYRAAETSYTTANHAEGLLDYDDLEIYAYRLLDGPHVDRVLNRVEEKILHYLVDEFQDTGELQWGIVERLNSEVFAGAGAEGMKAPTLFVVGDKKQSIYRFRKANYRLMDVLKEKMEEGVDPLRRDFPELDYNFRSAPEILKVVDEVFLPLIEEYRPARPYREDARGSVTLRLVPVGTEADALAEEVEAALGAAIYEKEGPRPARYGDMAVLIRTRAGLKSYEKALGKRGIPFKVVGGTGFFFQDEIQALINILRYLDNPSELLPLAAALKSPLFSLTDLDLEPMFVDRAASSVLGRPWPGADRLFDGWRAMAGVETVAGLLEAVIRDSGAVAAFGFAGGPSAVLNMEKLKNIAREYEARGGSGLSGFIEWVKAYRENAEMATADVELQDGGDYVSIMTVHTAKGLEFPVVFLPGAARGTRNTVDDFLLEEDEDGLHTPGIRTEGLLGENATFKHLKGIERSELYEESKRLLYVAMTRAMDHLVIIGEDRKPAKGTWMDFISQAAPASLYGPPYESVTEGSRTYPPGPRLCLERGEDNAAAAARPPKSERLAPLPADGELSFLAPSSMAVPLEDHTRDMAQNDPFLRGTIVHRALESYGKAGGYDLPSIAKAEPGFVELGGAEGKRLLEDIERAISLMFTDPSIKRLFEGSGRYFELPMLLRRGGDIIGGTADLVIMEGERASVIDYKTGLEGFSEEEIINAYSPQLTAYAGAVMEAFGVPSVECHILLVDRVKLISLPARQQL